MHEETERRMGIEGTNVMKKMSFVEWDMCVSVAKVMQCLMNNL